MRRCRERCWSIALRATSRVFFIALIGSARLGAPRSTPVIHEYAHHNIAVRGLLDHDLSLLLLYEAMRCLWDDPFPHNRLRPEAPRQLSVAPTSIWRWLSLSRLNGGRRCPIK